MRRLPLARLPEELRRAKAVCPQLYVGCAMTVSPCSRCTSGWDKKLGRCMVEMGIEHFPLVPATKVPKCPIQYKCQHQIQLGEVPCPVRARGFICESALGLAGVKRPEEHPLGFHAMTVASPEDLEELGLA